MSQHRQLKISETQNAKVLFQMTQLAVAESASLISSLSQREVGLRVESIGLKNKDDLDSVFLPREPDMMAVYHRVDGANPGHFIFLMEELRGKVLTREILNEKDQLQEIFEMEEEAFIEIGNIITNNCLRHYLRFLKVSVSTMIPTLIRGHYAQIIAEYSRDTGNKGLYIVKLSVEIAAHKFPAYLLWIDHLCKLDASQINLKQIPEG